MNSKGFIIMTFASFVVIAAGALVVVLLGLDWKGGNEGMQWVLGAGAVMFFATYLVFNRKWPPAKVSTRYLSAVQSGITPEEGLELFRKYSFLMLIASLLLLTAAIVAILTY